VNTPGTYTYVCLPHAAMGMDGSFTASPGSGVGILSPPKAGGKLSVSPNPVLNDCKISFASQKAGSGEIRIFDMIGNAVMNRAIDIVSGKNTLSLSLSALNSGVYQLQILDSSGHVATQKLIVQ